MNRITAWLLFAATRGEVEDHWFKTASNSERVALQTLLKQRVLVAVPAETKIIPTPDMIYGLDPYLRDVPPPGELSPMRRPPEDHPGAGASNTASDASATEERATPD